MAELLRQGLSEDGHLVTLARKARADWPWPNAAASTCCFWMSCCPVAPGLKLHGRFARAAIGRPSSCSPRCLARCGERPRSRGGRFHHQAVLFRHSAGPHPRPRPPGSDCAARGASEGRHFAASRHAGSAAGRLTFTALSRNLLNHPNLALPDGNLSSPYFGEPTALVSGGGGNSASGNRRIELQCRLAF